MTIMSRMRHTVDINNPSWSQGNKTDSWTNSIRAFVVEKMRTIRNSQGDFVQANFTVIVGSNVTVNEDSEIRFNSKIYPVIAIARLRRSYSSQIKHIEIYA